jgi:acyl-coenzyme A synthetase/AMP-(fatty) acid ligase
VTGIPLIGAAAAGQTLAWRGAQPVSAAQYLADAAALAARLPARGHVLNACADRYRFAVGLGAALLRGQVTLLPPDHTPETVRRLREFAAEPYVLADEVTAPIDLPRLAVSAAHSPVPGGFAVPRIPAERLCAIVFTSGSTGTPSPNAKRWGALARDVRGALERWSIAPRQPAIVATVPPQHMYGFESSVLAALLGGGALCAERPFYPADVCGALERVPRPRALVTTPFHLHALLEDAPRPPPLDLLLCATAPLDAGLAEQAEARFGAPLLEIYGSTETGQMASRRSAREAEWRTLPGIRVVLRGGEAWAEGGHIEQPTRLGDVLEPLAEDRFLLRGRVADMVNVAGKRSSLAHLDAQLRAIAGVADGAYYVPDEGAAGDVRRLAAFVVAPTLTRAALLAELRRRIDPAFLPRPLVLLERLPRSETGKLPREALRALARAHGVPASR